MEQLRITRTALAAALGVSKARISQILNGHDNLTLKSLVAVAAGLGSRIELRLKSKQTNTNSIRQRWHPLKAPALPACAGDPSESAVNGITD